MNEKKFNVKPLLFTTLIISICSIVYELIIGSLSSYLLGNSILQFSITIGLYLFAMGLGSYLSKFVEKHLFTVFTSIEILIGVIGSFSSLILFVFYIYSDNYTLMMYFLTLVIGILVGLEIPLLVRIIEHHKTNMKQELANLFAFDYLGGLIGSLLFPLLLLPKFGYVTVAFLTGLLNLFAATIIVFRYGKAFKIAKIFRYILLVCVSVVLFFTFQGTKITDALEGGLYRDQIIYSQQTLYQKIVMTQHKDDVRLFLDGNVQFSSLDEYRYHEALVHVPMSAVPHAKNVLLLGAGDGLAVRELLKYPNLENITLVDLDEAVVELSRTNPHITKYNQNALADAKVKVVIDDAFTYLQQAQEQFDAIIIDLPDPNNDALNKLYTTAFYRLVKQHLTASGVMVTQSASPYYTGNTFWCIHKTIGEEFDTVIPYHLFVPAFGDWGFNLATNTELDVDTMTLPPEQNYTYLNTQNFQNLFQFANDEKKDLTTLKVNTLFYPVLVDYYEKDTAKM